MASDRARIPEDSCVSLPSRTETGLPPHASVCRFRNLGALAVAPPKSMATRMPSVIPTQLDGPVGPAPASIRGSRG